MTAAPRFSTKTVIALLGVALAVRLLAAYWWQSRLPTKTSFGFGDSHTYWMVAESIAVMGECRYGPQGPWVFRTPGYPLLLAPLFWLHADPPVMWARMEGALLGTCAVGLVMWLAGRLFDPVAAYVGGAVAALYPGAVGCSVFVLSEAPYAPLLVAQVACWAAAWRSASWRTLAIWAAMAGLAGGAATLMRPSHLLFTPFALAAAMFGHDRRRNIVIGAFMLATLALTMSPWWIRNYRVKGKFIATTLQMGASLYDGLNPNARGGSDMQFVPEFAAQQQREDESTPLPLAGTFEERLDARMQRAAIDWSRAHPLRVVQLACAKLLRMWSPLPNAAEFQSWVFRLAVFSTYTPLILSAAWGAWQNWRRGWPYVLCVLPAVYLSLVHMVFVSSIRYREPAMLVLIVLAAGVWHAPSRLRGVNPQEISTAGDQG